MVNPISIANTFGQLVTAVSAIISYVNYLIEGPVLVANTQLQLMAPNTSLIVNNNVWFKNTATIDRISLTSNTITTNVDQATITFPKTTDTLVGRNVAETLINKTLTTPNISSILNAGTLTLPTGTDTLVGRATADTLTNKSIVNANIVGGSINAAVVLASNLNNSILTGNVSITSNTIKTNNDLAILSLPKTTDTLVGRNTTDTLTNKTLTSPNIATINNGGVLTLPTSTTTIVGRDTVDTLTNKTLTAVVITSGNITGNIDCSAVGYFMVPSGTTAQRGPGNTGSIRFNTELDKYEGAKASGWGLLGGGATGGGSDTVFHENDQTVNTSYTITTGKNAMSAGPIAIANGVTVTIPSGSTWTVV